MRAATELDNMVATARNKRNNGYDKRHPEFPGGFNLYDVDIVFMLMIRTTLKYLQAF